MITRKISYLLCVILSALILSACNGSADASAGNIANGNGADSGVVDEGKDDGTENSAESSTESSIENSTGKKEDSPKAGADADDEDEEYVSSGKPYNPDKLRTTIGKKSDDLMFEDKPYVYIENPSWAYYTDANLENILAKLHKEEKDLTFYSVKEVARAKNQIVDDYVWFDEVGCDPINQASMEDDIYSYDLIVDENADNRYMSHILKAYDALSGEEAFTLNFDKYVDNPDYHDVAWPYTEQHIFWAQCVDNILYVSIGHSTYSSSCPYTAYIVAIDLADDFKVLWKSEPLRSNSDNFVVVGDVIFTGYGFTQEDDFMYELNRYTGEVHAQWDLVKAADYFFVRDDTMYVRTYDTNYTFSLEEE